MEANREEGFHTPIEERSHDRQLDRPGPSTETSERALAVGDGNGDGAHALTGDSQQALTGTRGSTVAQDGDEPTTSTRPPPGSRHNIALSGRWNEDVCKSALRLHLLVISFGTGLLDATTYSDFGIFASNQTGNTLILLTEAVAASRPAQLREFSSTESPLLTVGTSLASFLVVGGIFGQLGNVFGRCRRAWLVISTLVQAIFLFSAAVLLQVGVLKLAPRQEESEPTFASRQLNDSLVIFLLASSAGIQVAMAKSVGVPETPSAMLTSPYADLITDPHLFTCDLNSKRVRSRNIRIAYIVSLASGTLIGAAVYYYRSNVVVIWVAFALRMANMLYLVVAPGANRAAKAQ